ncbi:MAG: cyclic nucleotide-binding/CBS domain-containing protein [Promethearchaeota archaeon]
MEESNENSAVAGEIMTPHVIMLDTNSTFKDVITSLHENDISAVFIEDPSKEEYFIVTKTDIINFLNDRGMEEHNLSDISVKEIMKGPTIMLDIETPIDTIIRFMIEHNFKRVLISKDSKPAGVVSTRDIMKWNNTYFKPAKPQILLFMDDINSTFIAKHIYQENIGDDVQQELIDIYGGAISSISAITDEVIKSSGTMRQLLKDKRSILFEPYKGITGILISDYNSIELRRKLKIATEKFYETYSNLIDDKHKKERGINVNLDINSLVPIFENNKDEE